MPPQRRLTVIAGDAVAESHAGLAWNLRVALEARHQAWIEAAFDRVDSCERHGDFEHALYWLCRADALAGGLPPTYAAKRARYAGALARRQEPGVRPR